MRNLPSGWRDGVAASPQRGAGGAWSRASRVTQERGFFTLIGLLLVIVIIGILMAMYGMPGGGGSSSGTPISIAGGAKERAQDVLCRNNLQQLRAAITIYQGNSQSLPPSLESLNAGVTLTCPVGGEPYDYNPSTGQVHCVHPGHESY